MQDNNDTHTPFQSEHTPIQSKQKYKNRFCLKQAMVEEKRSETSLDKLEPF